MTNILPVLPLLTALVLTGCGNPVRSFMTGLPPDVSVNQVTGFDPAKARNLAVVVVIGNNQGTGIYGVPTERAVLVRAVNDAVEARLTAKGYTIPTGKAVALVLDDKGAPAALEAVAVAKQLGVDLAFVVAVHELRETETTDAGGRDYSQVYNLTAQGVGVASGRTGWTGEARGEAHLDRGSLQRVVVEVATTIADRFPAKVQATEPAK